MTLEEALKKYTKEKIRFLKVCAEEQDTTKKLFAYKKYNSSHNHLLKLYEENLKTP